MHLLRTEIHDVKTYEKIIKQIVLSNLDNIYSISTNPLMRENSGLTFNPKGV